MSASNLTEPLGFKVTAEIKRKLIAAAEANGWSLSREVDERLRREFDRERQCEGRAS